MATTRETRETREKLGEITVPSGALLVLDTGLLGFMHEIEPPSVRIEELPTDRALEVLGKRVTEGEHAGRWRHVEIEVQPGATTRRREDLEAVLVDFALLMLVDAESLQHWKHTDALDGRADFAFWGRDAEQLAAVVEAPPLQGEEEAWGWVDLPVDEAHERGRRAEALVDEQGLTLATDFRPHSHHYRVLEQIRATSTASATLEVGGARLCALHTTWGKGVFPVERHIDDLGRLARVRVVLAPG
jgi:hypothetical protein